MLTMRSSLRSNSSRRAAWLLGAIVALAGCSQSTSPDQLRSQAQQAIARKDVTGALAVYDRALSVHPNSADLLLDRADLKLQLGDTAGTLADARDAIMRDPQSSRGWVMCGTLKADQEQCSEAIADFTQALAIAPANVAALVGRGRCYDNLNRTSDALNDFNAVLKLDPRRSDALVARGKIQLRLNEWAAAVADFHQADLLKAPLADFARSWCEALERLQQHDQAEAIANRVLRATSMNIPMLITRGRIRTTARRYDAAIADLDEVLKLDPSLIEVVLLRATAYASAGRYVEARRDYTTFLDKQPDNLTALRDRARLSLLLKDPATAEEDCDKYLHFGLKASKNERAVVLMMRCLAKYQQGEWKAAVDDATTVLQTDPSNYEALCVRALASIILANDEPTVGIQITATADLSQLIEQFPDDLRLLNLRAIHYLVCDNLPLAQEDCDRAFELATKSLEDHNPAQGCTSAIVLKRDGVAAAMEYWQRVPIGPLLKGYSARRIPELLARVINLDDQPDGWIELLEGRWLAAITASSTALSLLDLNKPVTPAITPAKNVQVEHLLWIRGTAQVMLGDVDSGLVDYEHALAMASTDDATSHHLRALVAIERGDLELAASEVRAGLLDSPADALLYATQTVVAMAAGDFTAAKVNANVAVALRPNSLAAICPLSGSWSKPASDTLIPPLSIDFAMPPVYRPFEGWTIPDVPISAERKDSASLVLATAAGKFFLDSKLSQASNAYDLAILLSPRANYFSGRGAVFYLASDFEAAVNDFTRAIEIGPPVAAHFYNRGNARLHLQQLDAALADYTRAIELDPESGDVYRNRAKVYALLKDDAKAEADLQKAKKLRIDGK